MPNILTLEREFQRNHVREAKGSVHHAPNHPVGCHREHSLCAAGGRTNPGALCVGTAMCICSHPLTQDGENKSGCCFHEKHFPWQKSTVDNIELWLGLGCAWICLDPKDSAGWVKWGCESSSTNPLLMFQWRGGKEDYKWTGVSKAGNVLAGVLYLL